MLVAEQRPPAKYFFKVSNQKEFLQIGESFLNDFNSGMKSFAITSTGYKQAQQRTILAIASFFDCSTPMKIAIITNQFEHSVFEELIKSSSSVFINLETHSKRVKAKRFFHHFDFILFDSIFNTNDPSSSDKSYEKSIKE
jgi:hypothetical protein